MKYDDHKALARPLKVKFKNIIENRLGRQKTPEIYTEENPNIDAAFELKQRDLHRRNPKLLMLHLS